MGLFSNILEKLGFGSAPALAAPPIPAPASPTPQPAAPAKPMAAVDVVAKLEGLTLLIKRSSIGKHQLSTF